jgi:hypothetical protein
LFANAPKEAIDTSLPVIVGYSTFVSFIYLHKKSNIALPTFEVESALHMGSSNVDVVDLKKICEFGLDLF